jgi:dethiobiotin synthetase
VAVDGDTVGLVDAIRPVVVLLVADAGLGTINAVRLSLAALADFPVVVALNRFTGDDLHERNREYLAQVVGADVVTEPRALAALLRRPS